MKPPLEKQLLRRLKILGGILFVFAVVALIYDRLPLFDQEIDEVETPPLNPFFVSSVFGAVGTSCLFISWKKSKIKDTLDS